MNLLRSQTQFQGWRNKSSVMKAQTGELEEATEAVVLDIKLLGESVSKAVDFHLMHIIFFAAYPCASVYVSEIH